MKKQLFFLTLISGQAAAWTVMPFHQDDLSYHGAKVDDFRLDTDGDGVVNWQPSAIIPGMLFPNDEDIDGDGVENFIDSAPYDAKISSKRLSWVYQTRDERVQELLRYLSDHNIWFVDYTDQTALDTVKTLYRVVKSIQSNFDHNELSALRYVLAYRKMPRAKGYYLPGAKAVALPGNSLVSKGFYANSHELFEVISHELGHAYIFSAFSPKSFACFARDVGDWRIDTAKVDSYYSDALMRRRHNMILNSTFPSNYAMTNAHEWFTENFASLLTALQSSRFAAEGPFQQALFAKANLNVAVQQPDDQAASAQAKSPIR